MNSKLNCRRIRLYVLLHSITIFAEYATVSHAELIRSNCHTSIRYTLLFTNINNFQSVLRRHFIAQVDFLDFEEFTVIVLVCEKCVTRNQAPFLLILPIKAFAEQTIFIEVPNIGMRE